MDATCHGYYVQLFEGFFPKQLLQNVIDIVNEKMDGDKEVVYGEFIWWIGIWVLMSTVDGVDWNLCLCQQWMVQISIHFDVGDVDAIKGTMDGVPFHIHAMKEPDYIMMLMSTYGMTLRMGVTKRRHYTVEGVKKVVEFQYPEIVHNHYKFCDMIDNHNSFQMHPISMEETWMTMRWANHMFSFLLTITIVNIQNAAVDFLNKPKLDALQSQCQIAKQFIYNCYLLEEEQAKKHPRWGSIEHSLIMVPKHKRSIQG